MTSVLRKIFSLPAFWKNSDRLRRRYGVIAGMKLALKVREAAYCRGIGELVELRLPNIHKEVALRAGTSDVAVFEQVFGGEEFDFGFDSTENPDFIVDAGANIGLMSLFFAMKYENATIVALEVEDSNFELLKRNTSSFPNIHPVKKALWSKNTQLTITNPNDDYWSFTVRETVAGEAGGVDALGVSDLLCLFEKDTVDVLKIDIEGAELEVFSDGADRWIDHVRVLAVELHDRIKPGCSEAVEKVVAGRGFRCSQVGEYRVFSKSWS